MFTIRADYREDRGGRVITKLNNDDGAAVSADTYEIICENLTVGDYIIESNGRVLIIERKTLADLVASIKDGRLKTNHHKLTDARTEGGEGYRVMYLIEGRKDVLTYSNYRIGGINTTALASKLDHIMMLDGCQIEYTADATETAKRILTLGRNMSSLSSITGGADVGSIVKKKMIVPPAEVQRDILCRIKGVGPSTAKRILVNNTFRATICDEIKTSKAAALGLTEIRNSTDSAAAIQMVATIKGISQPVATSIIAAHPINTIFDAANLADVVRPNGKRLGTALAARIQDIFNHE
jgi:ERCC4-type nuclease